MRAAADFEQRASMAFCGYLDVNAAWYAIFIQFYSFLAGINPH